MRNAECEMPNGSARALFRIPHSSFRIDTRRVSAVLRAALLIVPVAVAGTACRTARAAEPIERPALEVPPPPPRVIVPLPGPDAQPRLEPVEELPVTTDKSPTKPRPNREKPDPNKPADPKIELVDPPQTPTAPATPPLRLDNPNSAQLGNQVRETLARARALIEKIDRNSLTTEPRRKAYDQAKLFADEAEDALQKDNLVYAKEVADKAERLASSIK
jgi:hypothetical protein